MSKISAPSSDILVINTDAPSSPLISFNPAGKASGRLSFGWGLGWYPGDQPLAMTANGLAAPDTRIESDSISDWSNFRSTTFFSIIESADTGYQATDTQPFSKGFAGRGWLFLHNGDLDKNALAKLHGRQTRLLEPLGGTDSELAFSDFLSQMQLSEARQLADVQPDLLLSWLRRYDELGSATMVITDGVSVAYFQGSHSPKALTYKRLQPPGHLDACKSDAIAFQLADPRDAFRTAFVVCSSPMAGEGWSAMAPGQLILTRRGTVVWESAQGPSPQAQVTGYTAPPQSQQQQPEPPLAPVQVEQARQHSQTEPHMVVTNIRSITRSAAGKPLSYRFFELTHTTHYEYTAPVEHSTHLFRLQPVNDMIQEVEYSNLTISSPGEEIQFEDVFGNQSLHCTINEPYTTLSVSATSRVKIFEAPPDDHSLSRRQSSIPLVWMPWQRQMMMPYLLPEELPEPQLVELTDYAMSFVERNDYHLLRIINDMNLSLYRDFTYEPGSTSLNTTPFEVYTARRGVCQDFANLFICLTRLLSIPSRYRMGYIYTGANYENKIQSDASHAWAEVYLPYVGWRGFDPTNGCPVLQDHVRVACGRNYIDATPTSGTIYKGGGDETLKVEVKMVEVSE